jgi:hypothetical protein
LQQCADAVIRLRAEYLRDSGRAGDVCFRFTSGDALAWRDWSRGVRPEVAGARVIMRQRATPPDESYASFRRYLDVLFTYAGSASLERELVPVAAKDVEAGDVLIQGGHPGHAVLVVDVAANEAGERRVLLAQSYMPAQQLHVLAGPWYRLGAGEPVRTPEWVFEAGRLRRFPETSCAR